MIMKAKSAKLTPPVSKRDHMQGNPSAPGTLVEYGDYECSYCGMAYPITKEIQRLLGEELCFVFRNFPLAQAHPHAQQAAEAAEAAGAQGMFWEMHDYLYEHQQALDDASLMTYASSLGLDDAQFEHDMKKHVYASRVREDFISGVRSGVNGTPTFFINGVRHDTPWDLENLLSAIKMAY